MPGMIQDFLGVWYGIDNPAGAVFQDHLGVLYTIGGSAGVNNSNVAHSGADLDNAIPNSALEVWQALTTLAVTQGADRQLADHWSMATSGVMLLTCSRSTDVPTVAQAGFLVPFSMLCDCTQIDATISAGDYALLTCKVPGYRWAPFAQRALILSFWVKGTKVGIYTVSLRNSGADRAVVQEYTILVSDTWEFKTVTFPASPTAGTWSYAAGIGIHVTWAVACGSTFQATAGAWATGNLFGTANQVNGMDNTANNFRIAIPKLEAGSTATAYLKPTFESVLAYARRFYRKSFPYATAPAQNTGSNLGSVVYRAAVTGISPGGAWVPFEPPMNAAPAMTYYSIGVASADWYNITDSAASGAASSVGIGEAGVFIGNAQLAVTDAIGESLGIHYVADARL